MARWHFEAYEPLAIKVGLPCCQMLQQVKAKLSRQQNVQVFCIARSGRFGARHRQRSITTLRTMWRYWLVYVLYSFGKQ